MSRRFERKVTRQRRRQEAPPRFRGAILADWGRAMELAAECECPITHFDGSGPINIVVQRHKHGCPALRRHR